MDEADRQLVIQTFLEEASEQLAEMQSALVGLESQPGDQEQLNLLFRMAHTFKGNAFCVGLTQVTAFAHSLEDALEGLKEHRLEASHELVTLLLNAADALGKMLPGAVAGVEEPQPLHQSLLAWLKASESSRAASPSQPSSPSTSAPAGAKAPEAHSHSLRVGVDKLDRMLNLAGEIAVARGRLTSLMEGKLGPGWEQAQDTHKDADRLFLDLQDLIMRSRLVSIGPTFQRHIRTVRDLSLAQGKQARVVIEGLEVEVDTAIIEGIRDPITHMVRNAVDHGIELPQVRRRLGKDPEGRIALRARHESGKVIVEVADDGAGMDLQTIAGRAKQLGLCPAPERLSQDELLQFVLEPGFSTAQTVTEISGRGVGMDVVRRNVEALRGTLKLESRPHEGTTVVLALPLTLAIIEGFSVGVGQDTYVIPLESVVECVELPREAVDRNRDRDRGVLNLHGQPLPFLQLRKYFELAEVETDRQSVVVIRHEGGLAGLAVDSLYGEGQTVIKPLGKLFQGVPGVSGSALLGSGRVALILDVGQLFRCAVNSGSLEQRGEGGGDRARGTNETAVS